MILNQSHFVIKATQAKLLLDLFLVVAALDSVQNVPLLEIIETGTKQCQIHPYVPCWHERMDRPQPFKLLLEL